MKSLEELAYADIHKYFLKWTEFLGFEATGKIIKVFIKSILYNSIQFGGGHG